MTNGGSIQLEGLDRLRETLKRLGPGAFDAAMDALEEGAMNIVADAQVNLRNNGSNAAGLLSQSGHVERKRRASELIAGFFDTTNKSGYALYVENGRRAGKMPPPDMFDAWIQKKMEVKDPKERLSIGWALAKHIAKWGTQPHPFFGPSVEKNKRTIAKKVQDALNSFASRAGKAQ